MGARADNTSAEHDRVESSLFNLLIETSPYDPRLEEQRDDVTDIANLANIYTEQHSELQAQVTYLTTAVNVTLRQEIRQLDASLQLLKTISTPVFIQALAAEELMNRVIVEFEIAQEEIARLVNFHIPNMTYSLSSINSSHSATSESLKSLRQQVELLTTQADQISLLLSNLTAFINTSLTAVQDIQSLHEATHNLAIILEQNITTIQHYVYILSQRVHTITLEIIETTATIHELFIALPTVPSPDTIEWLAGNLSSSQNSIEQLNQKLSVKADELSELRDTITETQSEVESLTATLYEYDTQTTLLEDQVQAIGNGTETTVSGVEYKISQAKEVLENLRNFSDDTFEVAQRASEALQSVSGLTTEANAVLETVAAIQQNVSELNITVQEATHNTQNAENITNSAQSVSSLNPYFKINF